MSLMRFEDLNHLHASAMALMIGQNNESPDL